MSFQFDSSSVRFSREITLCYEDMLNDDVMQGNNRFWDVNKENLVVQIWKQAKALGLNGGVDIDAHR